MIEPLNTTLLFESSDHLRRWQGEGGNSGEELLVLGNHPSSMKMVLDISPRGLGWVRTIH